MIIITIVVLLTTLVAFLGYMYYQNSRNKNAVADTPTTVRVWRTKGYEVRGCRMYGGGNYNDLDINVIPLNSTARRKFNRWIHSFANTINNNKSSPQSHSNFGHHWIVNPYGVNSNVGVSIVQNNGHRITPFPFPVVNLPACNR